MWYHSEMPSVAKILAKMQDNPRGIAYTELMKVCEHYFGKPRSTGGSHAVFKTLGPEILASTSRMTTGEQSRTR